MRKICLVVVMLLIPTMLFSGWEVQRQPSPYEYHFQGIDFVDSLHGWVVGGRYYMTVVHYGGYTGKPWVFQRGAIGKTADGGANWSFTEIDSSICFYDVQFLDTLRGWVVGNSRISGSGWYGLILKTTDGGNNWEKDSFPCRPNEYLVAVDFVGSLNGWVTGDTMLLHTIDGGITWERQVWYSRALDFISIREGWQIAPGSVFEHTIDAGTTWIVQPNPASMGLRALCVLGTLNGFAVGNGDTLIYTASGGEPWDKRPMNTGNAPYYDVEFLDTLVGYACGENGIVVKTTDGGVTWNKMWVGTNSRLMSISVKDNKVWSCGEWTTLVKDSGFNWQFQLPWSNWLRGVEFLDSLNGWIAGQGGMVLHTTNGGNNWEVKQLPGSNEFRDIGVRDSSHIYAVGRYGNTQPSMWRTNDGGISWEKVSVGGPFIRAIDFVDTLYGWIAGIGTIETRIRRTTDGGSNWSLIGEVVDTVSKFHDMDFVSRDKGWLVDVVGLTKERIEWGYIWHTTDGGMNWSLERQTGPQYGVSMWDSLRGYSCGQNVILSTIDGSNWIPHGETGLWLDIDCGDGYNAWAVGDSGRLARTSDAGTTWSLEMSPVSVTLERLDFVDTLNGWSVGQAGAILHYGVGVVVRERQDRRPKTEDIRLTCQPNPFTKKVEIRYRIPEIRKIENRNFPISQFPISLCIYDVSGRCIRSLSLITPHSSLITSVSWDGTDEKGNEVRSGIYFIALTNKGRVIDIKKIIKIRGIK